MGFVSSLGDGAAFGRPIPDFGGFGAGFPVRGGFGSFGLGLERHSGTIVRRGGVIICKVFR